MRRPASQVLAATAAVGLTVALAQEPVQGAFSGVAGSAGNTVGAAANFCTSPGSTTLTAAEDSSVDEQNPARIGGSDAYIVIVSKTGGNRRGFVKFTPLPPIPSRCVLASATLRLYTDSADIGRTLGIHRAAGAWTEATLNWTNQPGVAGTPATTTTGPENTDLTWNVTTLVGELYSGTNNGFVVKDQTENGSGDWNQFQTRQSANPPRLVVTWD